MVDALLMDARSANGLELKPVDVDRVVARVLEDLGPRMRDRQVIADVGTLPTVRAETRLLNVIFQNLLTNAIKYGPRDGGRPRAEGGAAVSWQLAAAALLAVTLLGGALWYER